MFKILEVKLDISLVCKRDDLIIINRIYKTNLIEINFKSIKIY